MRHVHSTPRSYAGQEVKSGDDSGPACDVRAPTPAVICFEV